MLAGYYDDSADNDTFVVGGFISTVARWEQFTDDWQSVLDQRPKIGYYKAYEANVSPENRKGENQFRGFSRGMILKKEKTLAEVIASHVEYAVYSAINRHDFNSIIMPNVQRRKRGQGKYIGYEYYYPFHGCISATIQHLKDDNLTEAVDFFFDEQGKIGKWARDLYDEIKTNAIEVEKHPYLGVCVPHDDKKVLALQSADLWASRCRKWGDSEVVPDPVLTILAPIPCYVSYWPKERLEMMMNMLFPLQAGPIVKRSA
jgi:hypothetical protein